MIILGVSIGHDSAACLIADGVIVANATEERFTRIKHDSGFPTAAIAYCIKEAGITSRDIDIVAIGGRYLPPGMERRFQLTPQQAAAVGAGRPVGSKALQLLINSELGEPPLYLPRLELSASCKLICVEHHLCHAAAAYFTRGRDDRCLIVTMDGIGDNVSGAIWVGERNTIDPLAKWGRDASLGWFYGNVTEALGWRHGDGEGRTMGLAAYGDATKVGDRLGLFHPSFSAGQLARPHAFGMPSSFNQNGAQHWHFADATEIRTVAQECGTQHVAASAQVILEREVLGIVQHWQKALQLARLACAGGVFLNVKLNQRIWYEAELEEHWVFPDAGDSGLAMGAALYAWHKAAQPKIHKRLEHLYYGPSFTNEFVRGLLEMRQLRCRETYDPAIEAAQMLADGKIVGWFQGRMESGPRALGNRSILMSPMEAGSKNTINTRIKFREEFRPFCPSIIADRADDYLIRGRDESFMITSFQVRPEKRGAIPAVVHVDGTLRPQTVKRATSPLYYRLIEHFGRRTGEYAVLNTSFNIEGEPLVCHPREAIRCFYDTGLDALIIGDFILEKPAQGP
jgi:carbamoyltransferase